MTGGTVNEDEANEIATWNPAHAIEGWAKGYSADGDADAAETMWRALEIQRGWRTAHLERALGEIADGVGVHAYIAREALSGGESGAPR